MKVYQQLEVLGDNEKARMDFVRAAVNACQSDEAYKIASDAEQYYAKKNVTINNYRKMLYNALGQRVEDIWSSNYKLTHGFFRTFVLQQVQYVLSNGITFSKALKGDAKSKLGLDFDNKIQTLAKKACVDGVSFGFWNYDHLEVFGFAATDKEPAFCPIYDQDTGLLRAGIRYWSASNQTRRWTLYEQDGYTDYIQRKGEDMTVLNEKKTYITRTRQTEHGVEEEIGENYPGFPIIPFYANDLKESEIVGIRCAIDCYDFISSGMANNIDETSAFYWVLKGSGGMDDMNLVEFVNRMKQLHAQVIPDGAEAEAHTIDVPVEANKELLDRLKDDLYESFMLMNPAKALSGNMTATAIRLAYQQQDDKCGDFEFCIREFIAKLLELLGIDDEPFFKWNRIANQSEETQMVMTAAQVLDDETILKHLPWIMPEEIDVLMKRKAAEEVDRSFDNEDVSDDAET